MKPGFALAKLLRQCDLPDDLVRESRAAFVAQALAYQCPLITQESAEDNVASYYETVMDIINDVNETIALDTKLTLELFRKMVKSRLELLTSVADTTLLKLAVNEDSNLQTRLNRDQQDALNYFVSHSDFKATQIAVRELTRSAFTPEEDGDT